MIAWAAASWLVVGFVVLLKLLGLVSISRGLLVVVGDALSVLGDRRLNDHLKESRMRRLAGRLAGRLLLLVLGIGCAVFLPLALVWLASALGWLSLESVIEVTASPLFIVVSSVAVIAAWLVLRKPAPTQEAAEFSYSLPDQLLHRLAFCTSQIQVLLARLEDRLLGKKLRPEAARAPIFITGLPRAGTTLLLELCARLPALAAHKYADMPFLLVPSAWARCSRGFRKKSERRERAHADGMLIDQDSPEALEEMIWLAFWKKPYRKDRIALLNGQHRKPAFERFMKAHMQKIALLRRGTSARHVRYVSKNNLNISRLALLEVVFPDAVLLVPFREPLQHCASLLRQHENFLAMHARDPFTSEYMRQIGHFDFGENLSPIDFDGWFDERRHLDAKHLGFWLEYWVAAYSHLIENHERRVIFIDYEALCRSPQEVLPRLGELMGLEEPGALAAAASDIHAPKPRDVPHDGILDTLLTRARSLHARMQELARDALAGRAT